jgi:hypothetical protein
MSKKDKNTGFLKIAWQGILGLIVLISASCIGVFIAYYRQFFSDTIGATINIPYESITIPLILLVIIYVGFFIIVKVLKKTKDPVSKSVFEFSKKITNIYVIITVFLLIIVLSTGLLIFYGQYKNDLPIKGEFSRYDTPGHYDDEGIPSTEKNIPVVAPKINCHSEKGGFVRLVKSDILVCEITDYNKTVDNYTTDITRAFTLKIFNNESQTRENKTIMWYTESGIRFIRIDLDQEDIKEIRVFIRVENNNSEVNRYYYSFYTNIITKEQYYANENQKMPVLIAILSFSFFSIIAGMKNLRDLIEGK